MPSPTTVALPATDALPRQRVGVDPLPGRPAPPSSDPRSMASTHRDARLVPLLVGVPAVLGVLLVGSAGGALDASTTATDVVGAAVPPLVAAAADGVVVRGLAVGALVVAAAGAHRALARGRGRVLAVGVPVLLAAPWAGLLLGDPVLVLLLSLLVTALLAAARPARRAGVAAGLLLAAAAALAPVPASAGLVLAAALRRRGAPRPGPRGLVALALPTVVVLVGHAAVGSGSSAAGRLLALLPGPAACGTALAVVLAVGALVGAGRVRLVLALGAAACGLAAGVLAG